MDFNFNIPKIRRKDFKDNLRSVTLKGRDASDILDITQRSYLDRNYKAGWDIESVQLVENKTLEDAYRTKKAEMKEDGRHSRELVEQYAYIMHRDANIVQKIAQEGFKTRELSFNSLGNSKFGVYLCKHADVQLRLFDTWINQECGQLMVFKVTLGRSKVMNLQPAMIVDPTPNYDCHINQLKPSPTDPIGVQNNRSQIYLYEYDDDCEPVQRPRHCLPYAVITFKKNKDSIPSVPISSTVNSYNRPIKPAEVKVAETNINESIPVLINRSKGEMPPQKVTMINPPFISDPRRQLTKQERRELFEKQHAEMLRRQNSQETRTSADSNEPNIYQANSTAFSKVQTRQDPRVKSSGTSLGPPQTAKIIKPKTPSRGVDYRRQSNEKQHTGMGYQKQLSVNIPRQRYHSGGSPSPDGDSSISDALTDLIVKNQIRVDALGRPMLPMASQSSIEEEQQQAINQKFADEIQKHLQMTGTVDVPLQHRPPENYTPPPVVNQRPVQPTNIPSTLVNSLQEDYTPQPMEIEVTETSDSKLEKTDEMEFDSKISELLNEASLQTFEIKVAKEDENLKEAKIPADVKKRQDEVKNTDVRPSPKKENPVNIRKEDEDDDEDYEKLVIADLDIESKKQELIAKQKTNMEEQLEMELLTFVSREDIKKKDSDKEQKKSETQSKPIDIVVVKEETMDKNEQLKMQREKVLKEVQSMLERSKEKSLDKTDITDNLDKTVNVVKTLQNQMPQDNSMTKQSVPPLETTTLKQNVPLEVLVPKSSEIPASKQIITQPDVSVLNQNTSPSNISVSKQSTEPSVSMSGQNVPQSDTQIIQQNASPLNISVSKQNAFRPEEVVPQNTPVIGQQEFQETENQLNTSNDYIDYEMSRFSSDSDLESVRSDDEDLLSDRSSPLFYNDSPMKEDPRGPYDVQTSPQKFESKSDTWVSHSRNLFNAYSDHNQQQPIDPRNQPYQQPWEKLHEPRFYGSNPNQPHMVRPFDMNNTNQPRMMRPLDVNRDHHINMTRPPINPHHYERLPYPPQRNEDPRLYPSHFPGKSMSDTAMNYNPQDSFIQDTDYRRKPNERYHMDLFKGMDVDYRQNDRQKSLIDVNPETGDVDYRRLNPVKPVQNSPQAQSNQDMMRGQMPQGSPAHPPNRPPQPYNQLHVGPHEQLNSGNMLSPTGLPGWGKAETIGHTSPSKDKKISFKDYKARKKSPIRDESQKGGFDNILQTADLDLKNLKNILETVNVVSALKKDFHDSENDSDTQSPQKYIDDVTKMSTDPEIKYTGKMSLLNEVKDNDGLFNCYGMESIPGLGNVSSQDISKGKISISSILGTEIDMKKFESKDVDMRRDQPKITIVGEEGKQVNTDVINADKDSIDTSSGKMTPPSSCSSPRGRAKKSKKNKQMMGYVKRRRRKKGSKKTSSDSISDITGETESLASSDWKSSLEDLVKNRVMSLEEVGLNHWTDAINHPTFQPRVVLKRQKEAESGAAELKGQNELKAEKEVLDSQPEERHSMVRQWVETSHKKIKLITLKRDKDDEVESVKSSKSNIMDDLVDIDVVEKQIAQDMAKSDDVLSISSSSDIIYQKPGPKCSKKPKLSTKHQSIPVLHKRTLSTDFPNKQQSSVAQQSYTGLPSSQGQISSTVPPYPLTTNYSVPPPGVHITTGVPPYPVGVQPPLQPYQSQIQAQNQQNFQQNTPFSNQGFSRRPPYPVPSTMPPFQGQPPNFSKPPPNSFRQPIQTQHNIIRSQFPQTPPMMGNQQAITNLSSQSTISTLTSTTVVHSLNQPVHQLSTTGQPIVNTCLSTQAQTSSEIRNQTPNTNRNPNLTQIRLQSPQIRPIVAQASFLNKPVLYPLPVITQSQGQQQTTVTITTSTVTTPVETTTPTSGKKPSHLADWFADKLNPKAPPENSNESASKVLDTTVKPKEGSLREELEKIRKSKLEEKEKPEKRKSRSKERSPKAKRRRKGNESSGNDMFEDSECESKPSRSSYSPASRGSSRKRSPDSRRSKYNSPIRRRRYSYSPKRKSRDRSPRRSRDRLRRRSISRSPRRSYSRSPRRSRDRSLRRSFSRSPRRSRDRSPRRSFSRSPRRSRGRSPRRSSDGSPRRSCDRSFRRSRDRSRRRSNERSPRGFRGRSSRGSYDRSPAISDSSSRKSDYGKSRYNRRGSYSPDRTRKSPKRERSYSPGSRRANRSPNKRSSASPGGQFGRTSKERSSSQNKPNISQKQNLSPKSKRSLSPKLKISSKDSDTATDEKEKVKRRFTEKKQSLSEVTDGKEKVKRRFTETKRSLSEVKGKETCTNAKNVSEKPKTQSSVGKAATAGPNAAQTLLEKAAQKLVGKVVSKGPKPQSSVTENELNSTKEPTLVVENKPATQKVLSLNIINSSKDDVKILSESCSSKDLSTDIDTTNPSGANTTASDTVEKKWTKSNFTEYTVDQINEEDKKLQEELRKLEEQKRLLEEEDKKMKEEQARKEDERIRQELLELERQKKIAEELLELQKEKQLAEELAELERQKHLAEELIELEKQRKIAEELVELEKKKKTSEEMEELNKRKVELAKEVNKPNSVEDAKQEEKNLEKDAVSDELDELAQQKEELQKALADLENVEGEDETAEEGENENAEEQSDCYEIEDGEIEDDSSDDEVEILKLDKSLSSDSSLIDLTERSSRDKRSSSRGDRSSSRDDRSLSRDNRSSPRDKRSESRDRYSSEDRHSRSDHYDDYSIYNRRPSSQSDVKIKHTKEIGNVWGAMISHTDTRVERIKGDSFYQKKNKNAENENIEEQKPKSLVSKIRSSELITANDLVEEEERRGARQELVTFADWLQMEYKISDLDVFKYQKYIKCVDLHSRIDENSKNKRKTLKKRLRAEMQTAQEQIKIDEMEKQNAKSSSSKPIRSVVISGVKEKLETGKDGDKRIVCDSGVHKLSEIERLQEPFDISRQKLVSELEMVRSALKMSWKIPKNKPSDNKKNESLGFGEGDYDHEFLMRHDLQQLEAEILMRINHFEFHGVPNRRVPEILLTKKEKEGHFSEEGIFLVLTASISHKAYQNLLSLKRKLESTEAVISKMNPTTQGPQIIKHLQDMEVLHQSRKAIMLTIAGYPTKKRFSKLSTRLKYYKRCMQYIQDLWKTELVYLTSIVSDVEVHLKLGERLLQEQEKGGNRPVVSTADPYSIKVPVANIPPPESNWREIITGTSGTSKPDDTVQNNSSRSNLRNVELKSDEYIPLPRNVVSSTSRNVIPSNPNQNNARIPVTINRPTSTAQSETPRQVPVLSSQSSQQSKLVNSGQQRQNSNLTPVPQRQNVAPGIQRQNPIELYTPNMRNIQESRIQDNSRLGPMDDRKVQNDPRYLVPVLRGESAALSSPYTLPPPRYLTQERQLTQMGEKSQPQMPQARSQHDKKLESDLMTVRDKLLHLSRQLCHDDSVRMSVQSVLLSVTEALDLLREESSNLPKVKSIILECLSRYNAVKELMEG